MCSPTSGDVIVMGPSGRAISRRMPSMPDSQRVGWSSAGGRRPKVRTRTRASADAARTIVAPAGSSTFTTAARRGFGPEASRAKSRAFASR